VLLAAGALAYPWRRLLPAALLASTLWAVAYALLGVVSGGVFDNPLIATLVATLLVLLVGAVLNLVQSRRRRAAPADGEDADADADADVTVDEDSACTTPSGPAS
jgi:membrane protein DedA with SNARE-associated domain